MEFWHLIIS